MYTPRSDYHGGFDAAKARQDELRAERAQDRLAAQARGNHVPASLVAMAMQRIIQAGRSALGAGRLRRLRRTGPAPAATSTPQPVVAARTTQCHGRGA